MTSITVEIPDEVFVVMPLTPPDVTGWDGKGTPVAVMLRWIDAHPFAPWTATLLDQIELDRRADERTVRRRETFR
jgi:hypothetical protein